jgi:glycerol dehydrogenase
VITPQSNLIGYQKKEVSMFKKAVFPGKYIQGVGAICELPALIDLLGEQGLILASPSVKDKVLPSCGIDWSARAIPIDVFGGECCEDELSRLSASIARAHADVLIGIGGGKTIDTAKIAADRTGIPVIIVPRRLTTPRRGAPCYSKDGFFVYYQKMNPLWAG